MRSGRHIPKQPGKKAVIAPPRSQPTPTSGESLRLGIDVGFGHVKYSIEMIGKAMDGTLQLETATFPAVCCPSVGSELSGSSGLASNRSAVLKIAPTCFYLYGENAALEDSGGSCKPLHDGYAKTADYEVFVKAVLSFRGYPQVVERLVLGVPVHTSQQVIQHLKLRFVGKLFVDDRYVEVKEVRVIEQPVAGLVWHIYRSGRQEALAGRMVLTIDVGYRTVDWVVTSGLKLVSGRSGSSASGVHKLVAALAERLSIDLREDCRSLNMRRRIEESLRQGSENLLIGGTPVSMARYDDQLDAIIRAALSPVWAGVGTTADITDVLLLGGGAKKFEASVRAQLTNRRVTLPESPELSIVKGLQFLAEASQ